MDPEVIKRLCKFIPLLASDQDGEVVAAARAMKRALESKKLSFHDVVTRLSTGVQEREVPPPRRDPFGYSRTSNSGFTGNPFTGNGNAWSDIARKMQEDILREHERMKAERDAKARAERERQAQWHTEKMEREKTEKMRAELDEMMQHQEQMQAEKQAKDREEWLAKKIEVPRQQLIDECDMMLTRQLSLKEQSFVRTLVGLTEKYHTVLLSAKQHEWWQTMKMQHGV